MCLIKKFLFFILILILFGVEAFCSDGLKLKKSRYNYTVDTSFNFPAALEIVPEDFYYFLDGGLENGENNIRKMEVSITGKKNRSLTYDFAKLMYENQYSEKRISRLAFFPARKYVDVVYFDSLFEGAYRFKVIRYDFRKKKITENDYYQVSSLFYKLFSEGHNYPFAKELYVRIFKKGKLKEKEFICYTGNEALCGESVSNCYTIVNGKNILLDPYNKKSEKVKYYGSRQTKHPPASLLADRDFSAVAEQLFIKNVKYSSKGYLTEGDKEYKTDNLKEFSEIPFISSKPLKKEQLVVETDEEMGGLYICNGYYSLKDKTSQFNNGRVQEIEITYGNSYKLVHRVILEDIPRPQFVPLLNINEKKVKIKILSCYKGVKYDRACLNCLKPMAKYSEVDYYNCCK